MFCPKCDANEDIVFFLRHQQEEGEEESDIANCITILCKTCGYNQSFLLKDCLDSIFPDWSEKNKMAEGLGQMLGNIMNTNMLEGESEIINAEGDVVEDSTEEAAESTIEGV